VVSRITRTALTLGGAHGVFKRLEQLFRNGALGPASAAVTGQTAREFRL
jgi:hypothetical protein